MNISHVAENGSTASPTSKSATAKDTMKRLVTDLSLDEQNTAAMTKQLPTITITLMAASTDNEANKLGSLQVTSSKRAAHAVTLSVSRMTAYVRGINPVVSGTIDDSLGDHGQILSVF